MAELKPCPFCGSEARLCSAVSRQQEICFVVKCTNLDCVMAAGGTLRQSVTQAENAWNRRAEDGK